MYKDLIQKLRNTKSESKRKMLDEAADALEKMQWVSVKDRLPDKKDELYLVYRKDGIAYLAVFYNETKPYWSYDDVTHWMPLPEPPKPKVPTFKDVFLEKFPKTQLYSDGIPLACRANIFGEKCLMKSKCAECWNQPYFEEEEKE